MALAGGGIGKAKPHSVSCQRNGGKIIVFALLEHHILNHSSGGYNPYDIAVNQLFRRFRIFGLLAYRNLIALLHQPRNI